MEEVEEKRPVGKPSWVPTPDILENAENLAARGLTKEEIAHCLDIGKTTLYIKFHEYPELLHAIKRGQSKGISIVANALFEGAKSGNTTAQIFYLKARAKWSEPKELAENSTSLLQNIIDKL